MVDSWLDDNTANRHKQTYVKGFVDISGGDLILRNGQQYMDSSYNYSTTDISDNSITSTIEITENPVWTQLGHSVLPTGSASYYIDMSKDGTVIIVGENLALSNRGIVRVFQYTNNAWTQLGVDLSGNNASDYFGQTVAINADGTIIAVGSEGGDYCKVFEYDVAADGSWNQLGPDITGSTTDVFGSSVSLDASGHRLATSDRNALSQYGYIEVYDYDSVGNTWSIVGSRISGTEYTFLGQALRLSGDGSTVIAGGGGWNTFDGLVKVYKYDSGTTSWTQLGSTFYGNTSSTQAYLGAAAAAISYDGSIIAMGEGQNDEEGTDRGKIHTYIYNTSTSSWDQLGEDIFGRENSVNLGFGTADLTDDGTILTVVETSGVTANASDQATTTASVGYIYKYTNGAWKLLGQPIEHFDTDYFATSYSSGGGCISNDGTIFSIVQIGHVRVFELSQITNHVSNPTYKTTNRTGNYSIRMGDISNNNTALSVTKNYTTVTHDISGTYSDSYTHYPLLGDTATPANAPSTTSYTQLGVDISTELTTEPDSAMDASGNRVMLASRSGVNVYEYNHFTWTQLGSTIGLGASNTELRQAVFSGNGEYVATYAAPSDYRIYVSKYDSSMNTWDSYGTPGTVYGNGTRLEISYDGQTIIVGENYYTNGSNANNGRATVWEYTGDGTTHSWTQLGGDIILFNGAQIFNGEDVAINKTGNIIAVGAQNYTLPGNSTYGQEGVFAVFKYNADATNATSGLVSHTDWELLGSIFYGPTDYHHYGLTLRLNDDGYTLAHGGRGGTNVARYVQLYRYSEESSDWYAYAYARSEDNNEGFAGEDFALAISGDGEMVIAGARSYGYGMARQYKAANGKLEPVGPAFYGNSTLDDYGYVGMSSDGKRVLVASAVHDIARVFQLNDVQQTITANTFKNTETETQDYIQLGNKTSGNMLEIKGTSEITGDMTINSTGTYQYIDISHVPQSIVLMDDNEVYHTDVIYNGALSGYYCAVSSGVLISSYTYSPYRSFQSLIGQESPDVNSIPSDTYNSGTYVGSVITSYKESKTDTTYTDLSGDYLQFEFPFMIKPYEFNYVGVNPYANSHNAGALNASDISYGMLVGWDGTEWLKLTAIQQSDYNLYGVTKYDLSSNTHYINKFRIIANSSAGNSQISIGAPYLSGTIRTGTVPSMAVTSTDTDIKFNVTDLSMAGNLTIEANTFTLKNKDLNTDSDVNLIKYFPQAVAGHYQMNIGSSTGDDVMYVAGAGAGLWMMNIIHHTGSNTHFNGGYATEVSNVHSTETYWAGCNVFMYLTDNLRRISARHFMEQTAGIGNNYRGWLGRDSKYDIGLDTGAYLGTTVTTFVDMNGNTHTVGGEYLELHTPLQMKYKKFHYHAMTSDYEATAKIMFVGKKNDIYYQLSYPQTLLKERFYNNVELDRTDIFVSSIRLIILEIYGQHVYGRPSLGHLSFDAIPSIDTHLEITNNEFGTVFNAYDKGSKGNIILNENPQFTKAYLIYENESALSLNSSTSVSKLLSNPTGYVGIGTNKPSAPLTIYGHGGRSSRYDDNQFIFWNHGAVSSQAGSEQPAGFTNVTTNPGLFVAHTIRCRIRIIAHGGIVVASDERIKEDVKDIEDGVALDTLRALKPKTYEYIDKINRREQGHVYGFLAQDVSAAIPYSVMQGDDFIPNIYELADISNGSIVLHKNTTDAFTKVPELDASGNAVQDASGNIVYRVKNKRLECVDTFGDYFQLTIKEIVDENRFTVKETITLEQSSHIDTSGNRLKDKVFILGEIVDDFHTLKKDAIWTVSTAALQEVDRQLQQEKDRTSQLKAQIAALLADVEALENA